MVAMSGDIALNLAYIQRSACLMDKHPQCSASFDYDEVSEDEAYDYIASANSFLGDFSVRFHDTSTLNDTDEFTLLGYGNSSEVNLNDQDQYFMNDAYYVEIEKILLSRVVTAICCFGLFGNIFNLLVLIPKGLQFSMGRIEKFANSGLIALAVSDLCFCVMVIPHAFINDECPYSKGLNFTLVYKAYSPALINIFTMASTWLTVTLAIGRYLATCHPLRAREMIGMTIMKRSIITVCVLCVLFNIPRFWTYRLEYADCHTNLKVYFLYNGYMETNRMFNSVYSWLYFVLGIALPLGLLTFSNTYLIRALRNSRATRRLIRAGDTTETSRYVTMTLVAIVVMYTVLVAPAEIINFTKGKIEHTEDSDKYNLAVAIVNTLQTINFSFNFVLYCIINASFRRSFVRLLCCFGQKYNSRGRRNRPGSFSTSYTFRAQPNGTRATVHSFKLTEI